MLKSDAAFSGFSVDDVEAARQFYEEVLGLEVEVEDAEHGLITLKLGVGMGVLIYAKGEAHQAATFTVLNFPVEDIEAAVDELVARGVTFELYEEFDQDERGISRGTPSVAWFTDPADNVLSLIQE